MVALGLLFFGMHCTPDMSGMGMVCCTWPGVYAALYHMGAAELEVTVSSRGGGNWPEGALRATIRSVGLDAPPHTLLCAGRVRAPHVATNA